MKVVATGTRSISNILGGVETHCEKLFPRLAEKEALKGKRGEDIVYADVASQGYEATKAETNKNIEIQ